MTLPIPKSYAPMEAEPATALPVGPQWQYEPEWDGFRCLAFRDNKRIDLISKSGKPLTRVLSGTDGRFEPLARHKICARRRNCHSGRGGSFI